ncbi:MAG: CoB--CoM heterodisulfide reductase iron-sulfur subunit A family protein [Bacteroidales bacterium]|jgi:heterodisulfide reductase subunit A|nr:CoB--CoM heterodisulfide reductase iron-sulfur subunit A family protein [Bacteroidales bacterium]
MTNRANREDYDVLVVGGGIAGEEAALNLANQGFIVLMVEKDLSIGGKMIHLSKVFPTLDCGACITTPKVSETARHPNITIYTYTEVKEIFNLNGSGFKATIVKNPRYVIEDKCTGCQLCEEKCPVFVEDQYQYNMVGRKAVYVPFSIANPRIACIDIENCILCGACEKVCAADAIDFTQVAEKIIVSVKSVLLATGFNLFDPKVIERYGFGKYHNIVTSMQMERQLVPTRPYNNVLRPKDGKMPDNIAYVLCTGSRDATVNNPICSQVCCMYSVKQAQLLLGALPMADVTIYYLHIRAFGKGFEEFYQQGKSMGVEFVKGKIGKITEKENGNLILRYEDIIEGVVKEAEHDMVVLSVGIMPDKIPDGLFLNQTLDLDPFNYVKQIDELSNPAKTSIDGVFVAGVASGPMDIPDSILSAGAASSETAAFLRRSV